LIVQRILTRIHGGGVAIVALGSTAMRGSHQRPPQTVPVGTSAYGSCHFPSWLPPRGKSVTMALDARHRSSLYQKFVPLIGEDDANALMSEFPASEADELVTKQFLRAEMAELRSELGGIRTETAVLETG